MNYYLITYGFAFISLIITLLATSFVKSTYKKYSKVESEKKMTGAEVAREILKKNGLDKIYVVETKGELTDHYDPERKVIRLSTGVYDSESISACAIAAHECGHAIQDKDGYTPMRIRSLIIPIVNLSTKVGYIILLIGIIASITNLIWAGILLETAILIFQLITLPVEFDASNRALKEIESMNLLLPSEQPHAKSVLTAAALTYVASVLTAILEILRLIILYTDRK